METLNCYIKDIDYNLKTIKFFMNELNKKYDFRYKNQIELDLKYIRASLFSFLDCLKNVKDFTNHLNTQTIEFYLQECLICCYEIKHFYNKNDWYNDPINNIKGEISNIKKFVNEINKLIKEVKVNEK